MPNTILATVATLTLAVGLSTAQQPISGNLPAPELSDVVGWINTKPVTLKSLRGRVVVLHFWTFG